MIRYITKLQYDFWYFHEYTDVAVLLLKDYHYNITPVYWYVFPK